MKNHILAVDDETVILALLTRLFRNSGFALTTCASVVESFQKMDTAPVDLLITDLRLSDGCGLDVVRAYKKKFPEGKVIVITGLLTPQDNLDEIASLTAFELIPKPFELTAIQSAVQRALSPAVA